jgi:ATP-binding cassette subfamily B protein
MNLNYTLPKREALLLAGNEIRYCAPFDLNIDGQYVENGWFAASETCLYVLLGSAVIQQYEYSGIRDIKAEAGVGCGYLYIETEEERRLLLRYSMRHISRFAFIARGVRILLTGGSRQIESGELETTCSRCGLAMPGVSHCPKCEGRKHTWKRLFTICKPHWKRFSVISALLLFGSGLMIWQQDFFRMYIDNTLLLGEDAPMQAVVISIGVISSIAFFNIFSIYVRFRMTVRLGADITVSLRKALYEKIQELSLTFIDKRKAGELLNRVGHDVNHVQRFMNDNFTWMLAHLVVMAGSVTVMFILNWRFTLLILMFVPPIMLINQLFWRFIMRIFRHQWRRADAVNVRLQDVISGIRVVKAYGREQAEMERFTELTGKYAGIQHRNERFFATFYPFLTLMLSLSTCVVVYFGGLLILGGEMTRGQLVQFMGYANMLYGPLGWMSFLPRDLVTLLTCMERIGDVLDEKPDQTDIENPIEVRIKGAVTLDNVSFGYRSYEPVLEKINLEVTPGEMIGLVGPSGAGKSTLINLLMRLYDADEGRILIDGHDIRDYKMDSFHNQIGVVLQETFLFAGTVLNNIRFSKPDASYEEVIRAAKMANAHDFICKTPDGYNTTVGEHGYMLSGGERQRIAIARAILNDPSILILDEATSSLDSESEYQIQEALNRLIKGRTTFSIAHRLSTLRNADRIMVIDKHTCAEIGTHNELLRKKGIYYNLVMAQLQTHKVKT